MKPGPIWVLGRGGMLGSHCVKSLRQKGAEPWDDGIASFAWEEPEKIAGQFRDAVGRFAADAKAAGTWTLLWVAGAGTVGSTEETLERETLVFHSLLESLGNTPQLTAPGMMGKIFFASSAGTVYGEPHDVVTEETPVSPISAYGKTKCKQEELLTTWIAEHPGTTALIGRISNLYGEGQNLRKPQGIISQLCLCAVTQKPAYIYVPLDTIRDYLYVGDCASAIVQCLERMGEKPVIVKIFASECVTTLAEVIKTVGRVSKRPPRLLYIQTEPHARHVRSIRFRSEVWSDCKPKELTSLPIGIHRVLMHILQVHRESVAV